MRTAIISDIHSNLEAFQEVLIDIARSHVDRIVSLGDNIGYGPDPEDVLKLIGGNNIPSVMGNHELGIADPTFISWFNKSAMRSLEINRELLSPQSLRYIQTLQSTFTQGECLFVHGFPPDSITTYLFEVSEIKLKAILPFIDQELCFVGHTHELELISFDGQNLRRTGLAEGERHLQEGHKYLINAGSVGQPRDRDNHSKYLIWDNESRRLEVRFIPYDVAKTVKKILTLGLPRINADRLL
jgi:predicted phosphodiesterase